MNVPVTYPLANLLQQKGFNEPCSHYYINDYQNFKHDGNLYKVGLPDGLDRDNIFQYVKRINQPHLCNAPLISDVVMWIYKIYNIWISVDWKETDETFQYTCRIIKSENLPRIFCEDGFKTILECYEKGIKYTLKNLI